MAVPRQFDLGKRAWWARRALHRVSEISRSQLEGFQRQVGYVDAPKLNEAACFERPPISPSSVMSITPAAKPVICRTRIGPAVLTHRAPARSTASRQLKTFCCAISPRRKVTGSSPNFSARWAVVFNHLSASDHRLKRNRWFACLRLEPSLRLVSGGEVGNGMLVLAASQKTQEVSAKHERLRSYTRFERGQNCFFGT